MAGITNQQLFALYREEKGSNALSQLPEGFDESLEKMVSGLAKQSREDPSALKELENARKLVISIVQLRRQKIMLRSIISEDSKITGANEREQEFYEKVQKICEEQDKWLKEAIGAKNPTPAKDLPKKGVKILQDVPQYTASDGKEYGPFKIGDSVELPESEAKWMVEGKLAEVAAENTDPSKAPRYKMENGTLYKAMNRIKVYIDMDVPAYESVDGQTYGPFEKGERVELPEPEARHLIRGKLAIESD